MPDEKKSKKALETADAALHKNGVCGEVLLVYQSNNSICR